MPCRSLISWTCAKYLGLPVEFEKMRTAPSPEWPQTRDLSGDRPTPIIPNSPESHIQHLPG